jgi:hypothetical protein
MSHGPTVDTLRLKASGGILVDGVQMSLAHLVLSGMVVKVGDGVDASGGDAQATFTGTTIGQRVIAVVGQTKAADGNAQASLNSFESLVPGTSVEATVSVADKIVFKQAAGNKSAKTYFAILAPAIVAVP